MRGGKPSTELDNLARGLGSAEDPYQIKDLISRSVNELAEEVKKQIRYSAVSMLQAGRIFMAIKKKLGHGEWEDFAAERRWSWNYVRASMKLLEVVVKFPQSLHLPSGLATKNLLRLPMPKIEAALEDLPPEAVKKLTPWDLENIYNKKRLEDSKARPPKGKPLSDEEIARIQADLARRKQDAAWENVFRLWTNAVGALGQLADAAEKIDMHERHYDEIFKRDMLAPLATQFDRLVHKWRPIEEIQKRAEVIERPSFAH